MWWYAIKRGCEPLNMPSPIIIEIPLSRGRKMWVKELCYRIKINFDILFNKMSF